MTRAEVVRLIAIVTEEVLAAVGDRELLGTCCSCHAVLVECCPARVQGVLDAGASRLGLHASGGSPGAIGSLIDHTLLKPEASIRDVERLCREAIEGSFATVCLNSTWVATAAKLLKDSPVGVCSVVGFPLGASTTDVKRFETQRAIFDGASEIDMVINVGALKSGYTDLVAEDIGAVVDACRPCGVLSKVIIEAALLSQQEKVSACTLVKAAGADFVKTSTGFGPGGATVEDVELMRQVVGPEMGIKAAGGIRTFETAKAMVEAGATRIGASASVRIAHDAPR